MHVAPACSVLQAGLITFRVQCLTFPRKPEKGQEPERVLNRNKVRQLLLTDTSDKRISSTANMESLKLRQDFVNDKNKTDRGAGGGEGGGGGGGHGATTVTITMMKTAIKIKMNNENELNMITKDDDERGWWKG